MRKNNLFQTIYVLTAYALPISISGIVTMASSFIAMMMVASLGKEQLAAGALAIPTFMTIMTVTTTIFYAVGILIGHQRGKDKTLAELGLIVKNAFYLAFIFSLPAAFVLWDIDKLLLLLGQDPKLVAYARGYFHFAAMNILPMLVNVVISQFFSATGRPRFSLWVSVMSFPLTILLAYAFVLGRFGLPALGLSGMTCASFIVQTIIMTIVLSLMYIREKSGPLSYQIFNDLLSPNWAICKSIINLGLPIGIQFGGELTAMTIAAYMVGYFGATALAATQVVSQYTMLVIVLLTGLAQASSLLISQAYGKNDEDLVREYLKASAVILIICSIIVSVIFWGYPKVLIQFYMDDKHIDARLEYLVVAFFAVNAVLLFFDGFRHLLAGALRGLHDSQGPMRIGIIAMWMVSLPLSYFIGIYCQGGPIGLRIGFTSGFIFAAVLLFMRINKKLNNNRLHQL